VTRQLRYVPFGEEMRSDALAWMADRTEEQGCYHTDVLKAHLTYLYDDKVRRALAERPEHKWIWPKYVDWLTAQMTIQGLHEGVGKVYRLTRKGLDRARIEALERGR
jgi:hypothetical protein